ncbi:acyltransferase [Escherichia coli]|nr:acyltransferase [Escherichia coli]
MLRGVSIILVLIAHADTVYWEELKSIKKYIDPTIGVDLFFIISGYLMGATFIRKVLFDINLKHTISFYIKRLNRLFVPCLFWSFIVFALFDYWHLAGFIKTQEQAFKIFISSSTFTGNIYNSIKPSGFGYFWSLGVEFQFYLILPLILLICKDMKSLIILLVIMLGFYTCVLSLFPESWQYRANALYIGLLIWCVTQSEGYHEIKKSINNNGCVYICFIVGALILAALCLSPALYKVHGVSFTAISILLGLAFFICVCMDKPIAAFISKPIEFIGDISFSLYLCNIPVYIFVSREMFTRGMGKPETMIVSVVLSIAVATASRYTLEKIDFIKLNKNLVR